MKVSERLDRLPIGRFHYKLLLLCGLGWFFDSMDTGLVSFVLARLKVEWSLTPTELGWTGTAALIGMLLGGALAGFLSDRYGRKVIFQVTLLIFSVATGLCGFAWGFFSLLVLRLVVGFGLGGELPVAAALVSEFSPARHRGRLVVILESFWAFGWAAATIIAYLLAAWADANGAPFPWRIAFFIGALPALYVLVLRRTLPESPRYLMEHGRVEEAEAALRAVEEASGVVTSPGERLEPESNTGRAARFGDLFGGNLLRRTMMLWILWFTMAYSFYGIFIWLPTLLLDQGFPIVKSFWFTMIITMAQVPGYFTAAYLVEKIGRKATLAPFMLLCAVASYFFGVSGTPGEMIFWGCFVSFFNLGAWGVTYGYTPELYPTRLRGTGAGSAAAFGRLGAIIAPLVVGMILESSDGGFPVIFTMFAGILVVGAVGVVLLGEETCGRTLEEISG